MVYLKKEEWLKVVLPKLIDSKNFYTEIQYFKKFYTLISYINSKIKFLNQNVLSTSMVFLHKFIIQKNIELKSISPLDTLILCGSCLFISTKTTDHLISINKIIKIIKEIIDIKLPNISLTEDSLKNLLIQSEFAILESIEFDTNIDLPYKFIFQLKDYFSKKSDISTDLLIKSCHKFINDTFNLPLCLFFSPNTIAITCVKLMIENYKLIDINLDDIIKKSEYKIEKDDVDFCFNLMQKFYKKPKEENLNAMNIN